jgi:cell wall integrity and stress response component
MTVTTSIISILFTFNSCVIGSPSHNGTDILERTSSAMNYVGCYSTIDSLTNETTHLYQSFGWCLDECVKNSATSFALRGYECFCGSRLPPASSMVPKGECDMVCPGFSGDNCMYAPSHSSGVLFWSFLLCVSSC